LMAMASTKDGTPFVTILALYSLMLGIMRASFPD
jgi:hypothetical protein